MAMVFTTEEKAKLRTSLENGGVFLRLLDDPRHPVEVLEGDGNGSWKAMETLDETLSYKIYQMYAYDIPMGMKMIGLKNFVTKNF